jgi:heterodisulfide reductase subunit B
MGIPYFPGCTLATKAKNYDTSGKAVAAALGMPLDELPDWQCCGATFPLATDNTMSLIAPARVLIQAEQTGADKVTTLCAICFNVLKRTEVSLRKHPEQLERINWFVSTDETTAGQTYTGKVKVTHFLHQLRDDLGWKALAVNASDVAAVGGTPRHALVTLFLPEWATTADMDDLYDGLEECGAATGASVVGGDIVKIRGPFAISVTLAGTCERDEVVLRSGARKDDIVVVTGSLGDAALGLRLLKERCGSGESVGREAGGGSGPVGV